MNNLLDITLNWRYASISGYTQEELDHYFKPYRALAKERNQFDETQLSNALKSWYNGYSWDGNVFVYNPLSILSFFEQGEFQNFWFSTGTPTFLINLLQDRFYYNFEGKKVGMSTFESYDIKRLDTLPLLFQTGYLTIKKKHRNLFFLDYPNKEVKESMMQHLIAAFRHDEVSESTIYAYDLEEALKNNDIPLVIDIINSLFASIPYQLFEAEKEKYYHTLIHLLFTYLGIYIQSEVNSSKGRVDALVETQTHIYLLEFKLDKSAAKAIEQIKEKGYAEQHMQKNKKVIALGINFSSKNKCVTDWEIAVL